VDLHTAPCTVRGALPVMERYQLQSRLWICIQPLVQEEVLCLWICIQHLVQEEVLCLSWSAINCKAGFGFATKQCSLDALGRSNIFRIHCDTHPTQHLRDLVAANAPPAMHAPHFSVCAPKEHIGNTNGAHHSQFLMGLLGLRMHHIAYCPAEEHTGSTSGAHHTGSLIANNN